MKVDVYTLEGDKKNTVELPPVIFEAPIRKDLMHQALVRQLANARLGTHDTKTRSEVAGGGKKPWKQKGTGRARQGSSRSPVWTRGGKAHTPHPRSYDQKMPRQMRRAAIRSALSVKAAEACICVVENLALSEPKTKIMAGYLNKLVGNASVLLLIPERNDNTDKVLLATNNLPDVKILHAGYLNIRDLLNYEKLIFPLDALDLISANLG